MTDLPHTYTDPNGDRLRVSAVNTLTVWSRDTPDDGEPLAGLWAPTGPEAVALARAILAAAGDTGHVVVEEQASDTAEDFDSAWAESYIHAYAREAAESMRDRADEAARSAVVVDRPLSLAEQRAAIVAAIRALPLFPDEPARTPLTADTDT